MCVMVITGNPGVGKHTVSRYIAERTKLPILDISKIAKDAGLYEKNSCGDGKDIINDIDTEKLEKILEKILEKEDNSNAIIVGHLAPYVLKKNQVKTAIVLRRNPYDLIPVYKDRRYSDKKIRDNTSSEILGIIANDAVKKFEEKTFQINATGKTVEETAQKIMGIFDGDVNNNCNQQVDWLGLVEKNNDLGKFFAD